MMPASTKGDPVGAMAAAMRSAVGGLTALQSTKTGLLLLAVSAGANRCASATASPGGRIERMKSLAAISSSLAAVSPCFLARATVSALRPASEVSTLRPFSTRRPATAAPIMPGAMTATTGFIGCSPIVVLEFVPALRGSCLHLGAAATQGGDLALASQTTLLKSAIVQLCSGRAVQPQESPVPDDLTDLRYEVALANRMLANEGVLDAFGH